MFPVRIDDKVWPTTEHYFQAQKFIGTPYVDRIRRLSAPRWAFDFSRKPEVSYWRRSDWEQVKEKIMEKALWAKFTQHLVLCNMLLDTGDRRLVEHTSNDHYWGDGGDGNGKNRLGNLLMDVRQRLRQGNIPLPHQLGAHVIETPVSKPVCREQLQRNLPPQEPQPSEDGQSSPHSSSEDLINFGGKPYNGSPEFPDHEMDSILCCYTDGENSAKILQPEPVDMDHSASGPPQDLPDLSPDIIVIHSPTSPDNITSSSAEQLITQPDPVTCTTPVSDDMTQDHNEGQDMDIDE